MDQMLHHKLHYDQIDNQQIWDPSGVRSFEEDFDLNDFNKPPSKLVELMALMQVQWKKSRIVENPLLVVVSLMLFVPEHAPEVIRCTKRSSWYYLCCGTCQAPNKNKDSQLNLRQVMVLQLKTMKWIQFHLLPLL